MDIPSFIQGFFSGVFVFVAMYSWIFAKEHRQKLHYPEELRSTGKTIRDQNTIVIFLRKRLWGAQYEVSHFDLYKEIVKNHVIPEIPEEISYKMLTLASDYSPNRDNWLINFIRLVHLCGCQLIIRVNTDNSPTVSVEE